MKKQINTVGIVGLGLIGGSTTKAIKAFTNCTILGFDVNEETMQMAKMSGTIKDTLSKENLCQCDLILIAITPQKIISWVKENADYISKEAILVDLCGIKRVVMESLTKISEEKGFTYIGGHPMAGKEVAGFTNANKNLFVDASMILVPTKNAPIESLDLIKNFFLQLKFGEIVFSTPEEHDRIIAYTSQLAHITSSAYIKSPASRKHMGFSAGSYKDMTRVARLDPDMWTELFLDNADNLEIELEELIKHLKEYETALKDRNKDELRELLNKGLELKMQEPEID